MWLPTNSKAFQTQWARWKSGWKMWLEIQPYLSYLVLESRVVALVITLARKVVNMPIGLEALSLHFQIPHPVIIGWKH